MGKLFGTFSKRLKLGAVILLIGLVSLQAVVFGTARKSRAGTPANVSAVGDLTFKWVPIVSKSGVVTQIGGRKLPIAVKTGLFRPYEKALVAGTTGLKFYLFFPAKNEASIKQHLLRFPNQVPFQDVSKPSFIEKPRLIQPPPQVNPGWGMPAVLRLAGWRVFYVWTSDPRPDPKNKAKTFPPESPSMTNMNRAALGPGSPVANQPRLIALFISFHPEYTLGSRTRNQSKGSTNGG